MKFGRRLRSRFWKMGVDEEVDAEFTFHVEMRARELVARGLSPDAALKAAVERFGNIDRVSATCRSIGRRRDKEMRRTEYLAELLQDVTFACRQLLRNPGFAAIAVLTLALGIGATAAIFSAVYSVVLQPLPFPDADRLLAVYEETRGNRGSVSAGNFVDGIEPVQAFDAVTAIQYSSFNIAGNADAERAIGARVTAGFFDVFRMQPALGRVFTLQEDQPGREQVVVLSHRLWSRRFGSDVNIVRRQITLNERPYEIIGVMPEAFDYTANSEELWVPIAFTAERKATHDEHYLQIYGRLQAGASPEQALTQLRTNSERLRTDYPRDNLGMDFTTQSVRDELVGDYSRRLFTLLGAVGFVLLIACSNVANLLLARGAARSSELAVRTALGAGRGRIIRQLLTESLVLSIVAAVLGLLLAGGGIRALIAAAPPGVPRLEQTTLNLVVVWFTLLISLASAVLFGVAPALRAARTDVQAVLRHGGRSAATVVRDRLRTALIAGELALALLLLVGAGLLIRNALGLQRVNPGFDPSGVLAARLALPAQAYREHSVVVDTLERLADGVARVPGASAAAITTQVPMGAGGNGNGLLPEGLPFERSNLILSRLRMITPGYFDVMRIPILRGRGIADTDRRGGLKVMVISGALAEAAFPGQDPVGKRIACCEASADGKTADYKVVVGVAGDVRSRGLGEAPSPEFYLPIDQVPQEAWDWVQRTTYIVARTNLEPESLVNPMRTVLRNVAPGVPLFDARPMEQRLQDSMATAQFNTLLLAILGSVGLVLAAVGIYGVIAYFVTRRTQEIGVRMALGATRRDVVALIFRQAAWPISIGIIGGLGASALLTRVLASQLVSVSVHDPLTFAAVVFTLLLVAAGASLIPARRAAALDPTKALNTP